MTDETQLIELRVETHPNGRWTLTARQGPGTPYEQLWGELCANEDPVAFYRAVAEYMGRLGSCGARFTFKDMNL